VTGLVNLIEEAESRLGGKAGREGGACFGSLSGNVGFCGWIVAADAAPAICAPWYWLVGSDDSNSDQSRSEPLAQLVSVWPTDATACR
jgi:hypothetical protein